MFTLINLLNNTIVATLNTQEECNKVLKTLGLRVNSYTFSDTSDDITVNVVPAEGKKDNTAYLAWLEKHHTDALNAQDAPQSKKYTTPKTKTHSSEITANRNVAFTINGQAVYTTAYYNGKADTKKKILDRPELALYNACYESDRVYRIVVYSLKHNKAYIADKSKLFGALKHAISRGIEVFMVLDGKRPVKVTTLDIDNLGSYWSRVIGDQKMADENHDLLEDLHLLKALAINGIDYIVDGLQNYIRNSGYDINFNSEVEVSKHNHAVWDAKDGIQGNAWVDDRGLTHYTTTGDRYKFVSQTTLNDLLKAYMQVRYYETHGFTPERDIDKAHRDEFCQEMYGMTADEYDAEIYRVNGLDIECNEYGTLNFNNIPGEL